jgi:hypothetical protein
MPGHRFGEVGVSFPDGLFNQIKERRFAWAVEAMALRRAIPRLLPGGTSKRKSVVRWAFWSAASKRKRH